MSKQTLKSRELALENRLRDNWQTTHQTDNAIKLAELKDERTNIEQELSRIRLKLYFDKQIENEN